MPKSRLIRVATAVANPGSLCPKCHRHLVNQEGQCPRCDDLPVGTMNSTLRDRLDESLHPVEEAKDGPRSRSVELHSM